MQTRQRILPSVSLRITFREMKLCGSETCGGYSSSKAAVGKCCRPCAGVTELLFGPQVLLMSQNWHRGAQKLAQGGRGRGNFLKLSGLVLVTQRGRLQKGSMLDVLGTHWVPLFHMEVVCHLAIDAGHCMVLTG